MTKTVIIWILILLMMALVFGIMFLDLLLEKEKKKYEDLMHVHNRTLKDIERMERLLAEWEKWVNTSSTSDHPCYGCGTAWGYANSEGAHLCYETCEKLIAWNKQQKKEDDHENGT